MKTPDDVYGYRNRCPNYVECTVCYGCKNCNPAVDAKCRECEKDKRNICRNKKHIPKLIAKLVQRTRIKIKNERV